MPALQRSIRSSATPSSGLRTGRSRESTASLNNIAGVETTGLDLNFDLGLGESGIGTFRFQLMASLLFDYDELVPNATGTFDRLERAGTELGNPSRGFIEEKITLNNFWSLGDWDAVLSFRYLSSLEEQCAGTLSNLGLRNELCSGPIGADGFRQTNELDSYVVHRRAGRLVARGAFWRWLELCGRREQPVRRTAAALLFLRLEHPKRDDPFDRWNVLVPEGNVRELIAIATAVAGEPPQGGFSLADYSGSRRRAAL